MASVLFLNLSATTAFLAFHLSPSHSVSVAWKSHPGSFSYNSSRFSPVASYDPSHVSATSFSTPLDYLVLAPTSLQQVVSFHRSLAASLVIPHHTIILLDCSQNINLAHLIQKHFPVNPVCCFFANHPLRFSPDLSTLYDSSPETTIYFSPLASFSKSFFPRYSPLIRSLSGIKASISYTFDSDLWLHIIPFIAFQPLSILLEASTPQELVENVLSRPLYSGIATELIALASKQCAPEFPENYSASLAANFLAQPLPAVDASSPLYLQSPLLFYNYFHHLPVSPDLLLLQPILSADDYDIKTPYLESVFAFLSQLNSYNSGSSVFFVRQDNAAHAPTHAPALSPSTHSSTTETTTDKSQPEKTQDETPKNVDPSQNTLETKPTSNPPPVSSLSTDSAISASSNTLSSCSTSSASSSPTDADTLSVKLHQLELREQALAEKEQVLAARDQKLGQWSQNLRRQQQMQQFQLQGNNNLNPNLVNTNSNNINPNFNNPNVSNNTNPNLGPNPINTNPNLGPNANPNSYPRSRHSMNGPPVAPMVQQRPRPVSAIQPSSQLSRIDSPLMENPENIDMMSITSRKNRRSFSRNGSFHGIPAANSLSAKPMRNSLSAVSLSSMGRTMSMSSTAAGRVPSRMSVTEFTLNEGLASPNIDLDTFSSLTSNRYAAVDSAKLSKSHRSNSLTIDSLMNRNQPPQHQYQNQNVSPGYAGGSGDYFPAQPAANGKNGSPPIGLGKMGQYPNGNGPYAGPNGPYAGPNGPYAGSNGPYPGPNGQNGPYSGPTGPYSGPNNGSYPGPTGQKGPYPGPNNGPYPSGPTGTGPYSTPNGSSTNQSYANPYAYSPPTNRQLSTPKSENSPNAAILMNGGYVSRRTSPRTQVTEQAAGQVSGQVPGQVPGHPPSQVSSQVPEQVPAPVAT